MDVNWTVFDCNTLKLGGISHEDNAERLTGSSALRPHVTKTTERNLKVATFLVRTLRPCTEGPR